MGSQPLADRTERLKAEWSDGMSDIEGKAARGSSERVWATNKFQL
jgi:hypothetical protein